MSEEGLFRHAEAVMGTVVSLLLDEGGLPFEEVLAAAEAAMAELHRLDEIFSLWRPESPMTRFRDGAIEEAELPPEIGEVLELCAQVRCETGGYFDPWGLPGGLDPTGLVKGWAVERARAVLQAGGLPAGTVNGGGDVTTFGCQRDGARWRIGIQHPWRRERLACVVELPPGGALATSGRYERGEHLFNPRPDGVGRRAASVSVAGPSLARADAYATALAVAPEPLALAETLPAGYECYVIFDDGAEGTTDGFPFAAPGDELAGG